MQLIDSNQASSIIGCSKKTLYGYIAKRHLKVAKKSEGKNYFCEESIKDFVPPFQPKKQRSPIPARSPQGIDTVEMRDVIDKWKVANYDTGSADVQIGVLTDKITQLEIDMRGINRETSEFYVMRKELVRQVFERRKLLNYLQKTDFNRYRKAMQLIA